MFDIFVIMISPALINEIKIQVFNTDKCSVGQEWNYSNIVSPFSRIYLITKGEGYILLNNNMIHLKPGFLYLVPSYTLCGYFCTSEMSQYYLHFAHHLPDGLKIFDQVSVVNKVKSSELDCLLFERLLEINNDMGLMQADPNIYEKDFWKSSKLKQQPNSFQLETEGIIKQLLSRFIVNDSKEITNLYQQSFIKNTIKYIANHLNEDIKIEELASIACYSVDHYTRKFRKFTGLRPVEFINQKRIEKAQELLITTRKSQKSICEETGFNSQQYYTRIFKKICGCTPEQYRRMGGLI